MDLSDIPRSGPFVAVIENDASLLQAIDDRFETGDSSVIIEISGIMENGFDVTILQRFFWMLFHAADHRRPFPVLHVIILSEFISHSHDFIHGTRLSRDPNLKAIHAETF